MRYEELTYEGLESMLNSVEVSEGLHLEFKETIKNPDKYKKEMAKYVSSFANTNGGYLIFGISDNKEVKGIDRKINNRNIEEWVCQVIEANIEPTLYLSDPKLIAIPTSDKVVLIIKVLESNNKPHIVTESFNYYYRINDQTKKANHYQVRDMFNYSRQRKRELDALLKSRGVLEFNEDYCKNNNSNRLKSSITSKSKDSKPIVIISLLPTDYLQFNSQISFFEFKEWVNSNNNGHMPLENFDLYSANYGYSPKINGVHYENEKLGKATKYFDVSIEGYIEMGFTDELVIEWDNFQDGKIMSLNLSRLICYIVMLIDWSTKYLSFIGYRGSVYIQLSMTNMIFIELCGFNEYKNIKSRRFGEYIRNEFNDKIMLSEVYDITKVTNSEKHKIGKFFSEKICRAFGHENEYCYEDKGIIVDYLYKHD